MPTTVVTLLATPEDAERVALASTDGKILLVLRNPLDIAPTSTPGVRMAALMGLLRSRRSRGRTRDAGWSWPLHRRRLRRLRLQPTRSRRFAARSAPRKR